MKELSPLAQRLVQAGRGAGAPTDADKERIREALERRLAAPPEPSPSGEPSPAASLSGPSWSLIGGATLAVGVIAGALVWGSGRDASAPPPHLPAVAPRSSLAPPPVASTPPAVRPEAVTAPDASLAKPATPVPSSQGSSGTRPKSGLAEEVALLSRATSALHAGRAQDALNALTEHRRRFPRGHLSVERAAARAQALCQLGRHAEAERELARLPETSPQAARARRACGSQ